MDIRLIGIIKDNNSNAIGFRLLDNESKDLDVKDVAYKNVYSALSTGKASISGLKIYGNTLVGSNGSLDRYPSIVNGQLYGKSSLVIITQFETDGNTVGYKISDWKGSCANASIEQVISYASKNGIANGMIKTVNEKRILSAISGSYSKVEIRQTKVIKKCESIEIDTSVEIDNDPWSIEQFKRYMDDNHYTYELLYNKEHDEYALYNVDRTIPVLKIPVGVKKLDSSLFEDTDEISLNTLVLSNTVAKIDYMSQWIVNVEKIIFAEGITELDIAGLHDADKIQKLVFPNSLRKMEFGPNNLINVKSLDLSNTSLTNMSNSFEGFTSLTEVKLPDTLSFMSRSFSKTSSLKNIIIPKSITTLYSGVLNDSGIEKIDLQECKNLTCIGSSCFKDCKNLTAVYLPDTIKHLEDHAFFNCKQLKYISNTNNLKSIDYFALADTAIDEFLLTDKIESCAIGVLNSTTHVIASGMKAINMSIFGSTKYKYITLLSSVELIKASTFSNNSVLEHIDLSEGLKKIEKYAFYKCSNLCEIDLENCSLLESIGESAFESTSIEKVILPESISEIGASCFKNCDYLRFIVIPKSVVNIGRSAFIGAGSRSMLGPMYYVFEKSVGLAYCKHNKFRYTVIGSIEEALEAENYTRKISAGKEAKLKLLLSSSDTHRELLTDKFINCADILYKIYSHIDSDLYEVNDSAYKLNTNKYIDVPIESIGLVNDFVTAIQKNYDLDIQFSQTEMSHRFITLSNMITKFFDLNPAPLTTKALEYMKDSCIVLPNTIYTDNYCSIINFVVTVKENGDMHKIIVITIENSIKFVCACTHNEALPMKLFMRLNVSYRDTPKYSIADLLTIGDNIIFKTVSTGLALEESKVQKVKLPRYIYDKVIESFFKTMVPIGFRFGKNINKNQSSMVTVDIMCADNGIILTCNGVISNEAELSVLNTIGQFEALTVESISTIQNMNSDCERRFKDTIEDTITTKFFKFLVIGQVNNQVSNAADAYDDEPIYEWEVAQLICKAGIENIESLSANMFELIVNMAMYVRSKKTVKELLDMTPINNVYEIEGGNYTIFEGELMHPTHNSKAINGECNFITAIIPAGTNNDEKINTYLSNKSLNKTLTALNKMKKSGNDVRRISDEVVDIQDFYPVQPQLVTMHIGDTYKQYSTILAINKYSGQLFLLGNEAGYRHYYTLLRLKDLGTAMEEFKWLYSNSFHDASNVQQMKEEIMRFLKYISYDDKENYLSYNHFYKLRKEIMSGATNNTYTMNKYKRLFEISAKQKENNA